MIYFRDKLLRGNRSTKTDNFGMDAFDSPKFAPLGLFEVKLKIDWKSIQKATVDANEDLKIQKVLSFLKNNLTIYYVLIFVD